LLTGKVSNSGWPASNAGRPESVGPVVGVPGRGLSWEFMLHLLPRGTKKASRHQQTQHLGTAKK
jgi:hypothetical protein